MKKIFTEKGFSLIQSLIGVSLIAGASVLMMKVSQNSSQIQATTKVDFEIQMIADVISHNMTSPDACNNTLAKGKVSGEMLNEGVELENLASMPLESILDETGNVLFDKTRTLKDGLKISRIEVVRTAEDKSHLNVVFDRSETSGKALGGRTIAKQIPLTVAFQGNKVQGCVVQFDDQINEANKSICSASGGVWNEDTKVCDNCGPGQIRRISSENSSSECSDPFIVDERGICDRMGQKAYWSASQSRCIICGIGEVRSGPQGAESCVTLIDSSNYISVSNSCKTSCNQKILLRLNAETNRYEYSCEGQEQCPASEESGPSGCKCVAQGQDVSDRAQYCFSDPQAQWVCEDQEHAVHGSLCGAGYPSVETALPEPINVVYCEDSSIPTVKSYVEKYNKSTSYSVRQRVLSMSVGSSRPIKSQTLVSTCKQGTCGQSCSQLGYTQQNNIWKKETNKNDYCPSSCNEQNACLTSGGWSCYAQIELPKAYNGTVIRVLFPGNHTGSYNQDCAPNGIWGAAGPECLNSYNGGYNGQTAYGRAFTEASYECRNGSWSIMGGTGSGKYMRCLCSCSHFTQGQPRANEWKNGCWGEPEPLTSESSSYYSDYGEHSLCARDAPIWYSSYGMNSGSGSGMDRSDATQAPGMNACNGQPYPQDDYYY